MNIFKRIILNLKKPQKIPCKLINKLNFYYKKYTYSQKIFESEQNKIFKKLKLNRKKGIEKLDNIKKKFKFFSDREMSSEHEVLFSSISLSEDINVFNILEIGTFDGINSFLLSQLFPKAKIDTIDLPADDDDFKNFYGRNKKIKYFINNRNKILLKSNKITFKEMHSLKLINEKKNTI